MSELIGGTNELWWSETDNIDKKVFYQFLQIKIILQ